METKVNLNQDFESGKIVLQQQLPDRKLNSRGFVLSGALTSPKEWWTINHESKRLIDIDDAHVRFRIDCDKFKKGAVLAQITLYLNQSFAEIETLIQGKLEIHDIVSKFGFNSDPWTSQGLAKFIKRNKRYFATNEFAMKLHKELRELDISIQKVIKQKDDSRGNTSSFVETVVNTNFAESIAITLPIFKGMDKRVTFECNIEIEPNSDNSGINLFFDCPTFEDIMELETQELITQELAIYAGNIPVIQEV